jgi:LacI family transcriptional regulator
MAETRNTYLYYQTAEKIKTLILENSLIEGDKVPSERVLSERLGVAYVTVRKAMEILAENGIVLKKPRSGTIVRKLPENTKAGNLKQIGLTVWAGVEINHPGTLKMLDAAYNVFSPDKYKIIIVFVTPDMVKNNKWDSLLFRNDLAGLIVRVQEIPGNVLEQLRDGKVPVVFIDFPEFSPGAAGDGRLAVYKLAEYLVSLGHKKIAFMDGPSNLCSVQNHREWYSEFITSAKFEYNKFINSDYSENAAYSSALELFAAEAPPTAVIAGDDFMAAGILKALRERGLRCPEDVSVCCFGGYFISEQSTPQITVCRSVRRNAETAASEILRDIIETGKTQTSNSIVNSEIIVRASTGKAP